MRAGALLCSVVYVARAGSPTDPQSAWSLSLSLSLCLSLRYASAVLSACLQSKSDFAAVNGTALLEGIASLSIQSWRYKTQPESVRHIGPTAQDFHRIFGGYGESNTRISTVDVSQGQFVHALVCC